ncbi:hypothetical protein D9623_09280 [Azospirillum brasilense]|uniref:DUF2336 domain-containing protein n=1 Tax=Azospirillum brasilense TaxID=192 RepID=A0A0P0ED11_AZOBR|nr:MULTISPECIES: hypothetical protein [Azospirillum]ALJ35575.1 hypothetical protein AMK58_09150 [Azospirillum brasilense]MDW7555555.1 hypothetical protein [Azospirillum brasilense]MDW7595482.1 hypothetical protein [Azospirillum brasilense]MDW7630487.1 hypothetical protein [Azospirillum brasilense]MDX5954317.1 hypothetical protein [Azospirillum brasilense]
MDMDLKGNLKNGDLDAGGLDGMDLNDTNPIGASAGRYAAFRRLLSRFDHRPGPPQTAERPATAPVRAMLLGLLSSRRRAHTRRLWARWLEPVMLRDPVLLSVADPLPGCIRVIDTAGWWPALSRRMDDLPATVQTRLENRLTDGALDRVLASPEMVDWAEILRDRSLAVLDALRPDPGALALFLEEANTHRMRAASTLAIPGGVAALRPLDGTDMDTLAAALRLSDGWRTLGGRAPDMEIDELLACVRGAMVNGSVPPEAMALFAVAGLYTRRDPLLGAALRALLPLPLVDAAAAWLTAHTEETEGGVIEMSPFGGGPARGGDRGLGDLFEAARRSENVPSGVMGAAGGLGGR